MEDVQHWQAALSAGPGTGTLVIGEYGLPVPYRVTGKRIDCRVPLWVDAEDRLTESDGLSLVVLTGPGRWLYLRGHAEPVADPDWTGLAPHPTHRIPTDHLYQLLRIRPVRIELVDETRGWGHRETLDL